MPIEGLKIRRADPSDRAALVAVCQESLGWRVGDPNEAFFSWKHDSNSFGRSPMWVAEDDGEIIGVRVFMRWRFTDAGGRTINAVRAVDTATSPKAQGRGVFSALTLGAIPDLRDDGIDAIFNTPNDKSRPGYIKMGWNEVGRVPIAVRVRSPLGARRLVGANTPAEMWSEATTFGDSAADVFADASAGAELLETAHRAGRITTDRDPAYLAWRYSFGPLRYRVLPLSSSLRGGAVIFRVRRRGTATEVAVCDVITPPRTAVAGAFGAILRGTGADYLVAGATPAAVAGLCIPAPPLGPRLTWRAINRLGKPTIGDLQLSVGDVELF